MNVLIQIHYITNDNKVYQKGSFPLKGRKVEKVALAFWNRIKREHPYECELERLYVMEKILQR
jgi:predicted neuraminidase